MSQDLVAFEELKANIAVLVSPARAITVTDFKSSERAIEAVKQIKELTSRIEGKRTELVKPLNDRVKEINAYAKSISQPLSDADSFLRSQINAFAAEQERLKQEEEARLERERLAKEEELRQKHEAERAALEADQSLEQEAAALFGAEDGEAQADQHFAQDLALIEKQEQEAALAQVEIKQKQWDVKNQQIKNVKKTLKAELIDVSLVPREFLIITLNEKAVIAAAKAGVMIPGVKITEELNVAIGKNTYVPRQALAADRERKNG